MKHIYLLLTAAALSVSACSHDHAGHEGHDAEHGHDHHPAHSHQAEGADEHEHHDDGVITLKPEMAARLGVEVDTARIAPMARVIKVSGIVEPAADSRGTASAPTAGIVTLARGIEVGAEVRAGQLIATVRADAVSGGDANRAARAELTAARTELERVEDLWRDRLVTRAEYNAAVAAAERAAAAYSGAAASGRVTAPVSGVITSIDAASGRFVETGAPVASVGSAATLTLRADVPAGRYAEAGDITDARISLPYAGGKTLLLSEAGGRRAGASASGGAAGYVPVAFTFSSPDVIPGTAVDTYLLGSGSADVLSVPASAIVEQQGDYYVYVRLDDDCYTKLPVTPGATDGNRRAILAGLHGGEAVVSRGTTAITLAAAAGSVPAGHSHSH